MCIIVKYYLKLKIVTLLLLGVRAFDFISYEVTSIYNRSFTRYNILMKSRFRELDLTVYKMNEMSYMFTCSWVKELKMLFKTNFVSHNYLWEWCTWQLYEDLIPRSNKLKWLLFVWIMKKIILFCGIFLMMYFSEIFSQRKQIKLIHHTAKNTFHGWLCGHDHNPSLSRQPQTCLKNTKFEPNLTLLYRNAVLI